MSVLWLLPFHAGKTVINGMESALVLALLSLAARARGRTLAVALALVPLARLDLLAFAVAYAGLSSLRRQSPPRLVAPPLGSAAAWATFNAWFAGSPIPVSLAVKSAAITWGGALLAVALLGAALAVAWRWRARPDEASLGVQCAVVLADGVARHQVPEVWHLVPWWLASLLVAEAVEVARPRSRLGVGVVAAVLLVTAWSWRRRLEPTSWSAYAAAQRTGEWVAQQPDALVAGWDIGIASAFSGRRVLQLEGLVNSWHFKREVIDRSRASAWLDERGVELLMQPLPSAQLVHGRTRFIEGVDVSRWCLVHAEPFEFKGLLEPRVREMPLGGFQRCIEPFNPTQGGIGAPQLEHHQAVLHDRLRPPHW